MAQQSTGGLGVANVTPYGPDSRINNLPGYGDIKEPEDNAPSDTQPPGVDQKKD